MTNLAPPEIDPTYLTDSYPDYYCCRVIKTQARLQALVADALISGTLSISGFVINVSFELSSLLESCEQIGLEKDNIYIVKCPFLFLATGSTFNQLASFCNVEFGKEVSFMCSTFNHRAHFEYVTFNKYVDFQLATFKKYSIFKQIQFNYENKLSLSGITIEDQLHFNVSKIKNPIKINVPRIQKMGCIILDYKEHNTNPPMLLQLEGIECDGDAVRVKIRNLSPESNAEIQFKDCHFYGKNVAFTNVAMKHVSIERGNTVKGMLFDHCDFSTTSPTEWGLSKLQFRSLAQEEKWIDSPDKEKIKERALVYASLKTTATQGGETQLANDFHFWQQYYQGKLAPFRWLKPSSWWSWNRIYKYTSAYGLSIGLPVFWSILIWDLFSLIFYNCLHFINHDAFWISLFSSIPLFGGKETIISLYGTPPKVYTFTAGFWACFGFQSFLQSFLAFQIGAAIRNKVKR